MRTRMVARSRDCSEYNLLSNWQMRRERAVTELEQNSDGKGSTPLKESGKSPIKLETQSEKRNGPVNSADSSEESSPASRTRSRGKPNMAGQSSIDAAAAKPYQKKAIAKTEKNEIHGSARTRAIASSSGKMQNTGDLDHTVSGNAPTIPGNRISVKGNAVQGPDIQPVNHIAPVRGQDVDLPVPQPYMVNEKVLCSERGRMYPAKVLATRWNNGTMEYRIHFYGWNDRFDQWVTENRLQVYNDDNLDGPVKTEEAQAASRRVGGKPLSGTKEKAAVKSADPKPTTGKRKAPARMSTGGISPSFRPMLSRNQATSNATANPASSTTNMKSANQKIISDSPGNGKRKAPARMSTGGLSPSFRLMVSRNRATMNAAANPASSTSHVKSANRETNANPRGYKKNGGSGRMSAGGLCSSTSMIGTKYVRGVSRRAATPTNKRRGEIEPERPNDSYSWLGCYIGKKLQSFPEPKRSRVESKLLQVLAEEADEQARGGGD